MVDERTPEQKKHFECVDCNKDTMNSVDYYMVTDAVWEKHGVGNDMLCIGCIEKRIGHKLKANDLVHCPVNLHYNPYTISILN